MSKVSDIHDNLVALVRSILTTHKELPNPYIPEENNELYLTKGFGVAVGPGNRTDRLISCKHSYQRDYVVLLTRKMEATDHQTSRRQTVAKDILDDHFAVMDALEKDSTLSGEAIKAEFFSDSGIEFIEVDTSRYFIMSIDVTTEYLEDLT